MRRIFVNFVLQISGKSHPWTNTIIGGNFRRTFRTIRPYEFPRKRYGPMIGPYEFPPKFVRTNGAQSSLNWPRGSTGVERYGCIPGVGRPTWERSLKKWELQIPCFKAFFLGREHFGTRPPGEMAARNLTKSPRPIPYPRGPLNGGVSNGGVRDLDLSFLFCPF